MTQSIDYRHNEINMSYIAFRENNMKQKTFWDHQGEC